MANLHLLAILISVAALFGYINRKTFRLPTIVGILFLSLVATLAATGIDAYAGLGLRALLIEFLSKLKLSELVLDSMLAFLLFSSAMQVDLSTLLTRKWTILTLATVGVVFSALVLGAGFYGIFRVVGLAIPFVWCFLLGAIIAPTDPIAILGTLKHYGVPKGLRATIEGESLFNDGVAIVLFSVLLDLATGHTTHFGLVDFVQDFVREFFGAIVLGLLTGGIVLLLIRSISEYSLALMLSLGLVSSTYTIAQSIEVSGPISVVVAGLLIGNHGARQAMSAQTRERIKMFWEMIDEILNAVLFLMIGVEVIAIHLDGRSLLAAAFAIPIMVLVRAASVGLGALPLVLDSPQKWRALVLLTWAGLRGGISVALALSIPEQAFRTPLITVCYGVVLFTMLFQAPTLPWLIQRIFPIRA